MLTLNEVIENLQQLFALAEYNTAAEIVKTAREIPDLYNETVAIYDANLCLMNNDYPQMWEAIRRGLACDCKNSELYVLLGEYYLQTNPNQAYLCFENALFYCNDENDRPIIQGYMDTLKKEHDITVRKTSFIILSYNLLDYTRECIESIRENTPESAREIVVVDNASKDGSVEWLKQQTDIILRANTENSGFPKGCNEGVEVASKDNDIFLFNNDTHLPPNALFWLRMGLYENESHGAVGSVSNSVSNLQRVLFSDSSTDEMLEFAQKNNVPMLHPYESKTYLVGFALLIRRDVYDKIGDLDECFSPGNYEDTDYGLRVLDAGYKNILCKNSFIIHYGSKSFRKKANTYTNILAVNRTKFEDKWNVNVLDDLYPHKCIIDSVKKPADSSFRVLDIGCRLGASLAYLKGKYPNATIYGIESDAKIATMAASLADVTCTDISSMTELPWPDETFDYIVLNKTLEEVPNPEHLLKLLSRYLKKDGQLIAAVHNVKHYSVMMQLIMKDRLPYGNYGILNSSHHRLYTGTEIQYLLSECGYEPTLITQLFAEQPSDATRKYVETLNQLSENKDINQYLTYEYVVTAGKTTA